MKSLESERTGMNNNMNRKGCVVAWIIAIFVGLSCCAAKQVQETSKKGQLYAAVVSGRASLVNKLLNEGVSPNLSRPYMGSLLTQAAVHGRIDIIKLLLAHGADPNSAGNQGLLVAAINSGKLSVVQLLMEAGARVRDFSRKSSGEDVLVAAIWKGNPKILKYLLDHGADPNGIDAINGGTAIQLAAIRGDVDVMQMLLAAGADINHRNHNGMTALMLACQEGQIKAAEFLLAHGADPRYKDKHGRTAGTFAKEYKGPHAKELRVLCAGKAKQ
jgi:ankyrin repeat protein